MADIDLKTETPDTSLPTTGFLFGADSQAAASPSVFTVQSVATTLLGSTTLTGATITADAPVLNLAQTWNASGVTFTGLRFNAATGSSANSAAGSLLMDLQLEGSSKFKVSKTGSVFLPNVDVSAYLSFGNDGYWGRMDAFGWQMRNANGYIGIGPAASSSDVLLTRRAAANLRLGAADAAAPVAQTLSVQSVVAGTSNTAGANLTITGSQGTGTGAGGSIIFQVAPAGSSGTAQNALATALTINPSGTVSIGGLTIDPSNGGITFLQTFGITMQTSNAFIIRHGNNDGLDVRPVSSGAPNILLKNASNAIQSALWGEATNTLALRNGANAQAFNIYNTFTDASNYERASFGWSSNIFNMLVGAAGTGTQRGVAIGMAGSGGFINFWAGTPVWQITSGGTFQAVTDNAYDIGASGANRPRNLYLGGSIVVSSASAITFDGRAEIRSYGSGQITLWNSAGTDFGRLQFGGTSSSFPAIKRSSTTLQVRLADDSGDADLTAKALTLSGNLTISTKDIVTDTTTGTKIGTATTQKIGFFNAAPVVQPTAVADATDNATAITQLNALLSRMRDLGLIAT